MSYEATLEIKHEGKVTLTARGGFDGKLAYLEFLASGKPSIRAEWQNDDVAKYRSSEGGIPTKVTIDQKASHSLHYRRGMLYEGEEPWAPRDLKVWSDYFTGLPVVAQLGVREMRDWASCMGSMTTIGGGLGAALGSLGGPAGMGSGAAIGAGLGASFGAGYCTTSALMGRDLIGGMPDIYYPYPVPFISV